MLFSILLDKIKLKILTIRSTNCILFFHKDIYTVNQNYCRYFKNKR